MAALDACGVRYLIIGGIAVGFYAEPRFTKDLDVLVSVGPENYMRFYEALRDYGAPVHFVRPEEFLQDDFVYFIGLPPWRIDLLTSVPGVDFEQAYAVRKRVELGGVTVDCISLDWLVRAKEASGRTQDLADLEILRSNHREPDEPSQ